MENIKQTDRGLEGGDRKESMSKGASLLATLAGAVLIGGIAAPDNANAAETLRDSTRAEAKGGFYLEDAGTIARINDINRALSGNGFVFEYAPNTRNLTGGDQIRINNKSYGRYDGNAEQFAATPLDTLKLHGDIIHRIENGQAMPAVNHTVGMTDIKISPYAGEVMKILGINYGQGVMTGLSGLDKVQVILAKPENIAVELYAYLLQNKLVACLKEQVIDSQGRARNVVKAYDVTNTDNGLSMKPADIHVQEKCFK